MNKQKTLRINLSPGRNQNKENLESKNQRPVFYSPKSDNRIVFKDLVFCEHSRFGSIKKKNFPAARFLPPLKPALHRPRNIYINKPAHLISPSMLTITFSSNKISRFRSPIEL